MPFPSPGDLPNPGIKSCLPGGFFTTESPGKSHAWGIHVNNLLGFLLLISPSLLGSQPRTQTCRQKTIFTPLHYENLATGQDTSWLHTAGCVYSHLTSSVLSLCGDQSAFSRACIETDLHILPLVFWLHFICYFFKFYNCIFSRDLESCILGHNT